ncbi:MAG: 3-methyl-2-oxobutanoate dehydrogenase subunit VorB, partial [Roseiflexaceae bacterium]|nr:3-methyl-2-oxobutanoate dehydrogenase subunit VorB [Roseiflexaceae bacterium]
MARELLKGNEAIAEAAIRAGLDAYFGYPITPQTELLEYLSRRMPELGRAFVQAESEVAAINMVYGAACAGKRAMTSSSGPGISLMQEGLSYIAGAELPAVVVDVMRGGPGLGNIAASQSDYFQVTRSAGHGDFRPLTLAPATIQEAIDLTGLAFDLAERYRMLVILLIDGNLGQMMEPAELPPFRQHTSPTPEWAVSGAEGRPHRIITSLYLQPEALERHNLKLQKKLAVIAEREQRFAGLYLEDADLIVVAFGSAARLAQNAVEAARARGMAVGLFRPITLSPFPMRALERLAPRARAFLVVEMNAGQMVEDVRLAVAGRAPVRFYGRLGGVEMLPDEVLQAIEQAIRDTRV